MCLTCTHADPNPNHDDAASDVGTAAAVVLVIFIVSVVSLAIPPTSFGTPSLPPGLTVNGIADWAMFAGALAAHFRCALRAACVCCASSLVVRELPLLLHCCWRCSVAAAWAGEDSQGPYLTRIAFRKLHRI